MTKHKLFRYHIGKPGRVFIGEYPTGKLAEDHRAFLNRQAKMRSVRNVMYLVHTEEVSDGVPATTPGPIAASEAASGLSSLAAFI